MTAPVARPAPPPARAPWRGMVVLVLLVGGVGTLVFGRGRVKERERAEGAARLAAARTDASLDSLFGATVRAGTTLIRASGELERLGFYCTPEPVPARDAADRFEIVCNHHATGGTDARTIEVVVTDSAGGAHRLHWAAMVLPPDAAARTTATVAPDSVRARTIVLR